MRRLIELSFLTLICLLLFTACNKKQHAIDNLSGFVEKVNKNASEYTDKDWDEANKEYDEIIAEIEKYEYSKKEAERIAELKGKYVGIKAKKGVKDLIEDVDKAIHEVKGALKGLKDGILGSEMQSPVNKADTIESSGE